MRAKFINETFKKESDPIDDMKIGEVECPECEGQGSYPEHNRHSIDYETGDHDCRYCPIEIECERCLGTGYVLRSNITDIEHKDNENDLPF